MTRWQGREIVEALNLLALPADFEATGISIDSRTLKPGDLYVAIKGEKLDGHFFIEDALAKGAAAAIVSHPITLPQSKFSYFLVDDTLKALNQLASYARQRTPAQVIALTGSAGKTTTKEWLASILSNFGNTVFSHASYNNQWGVPFSLAALDKDTQYGVFEIGMNNGGEIAPLAQLVKVDIAVITTIAEAHIGHLGSLDAIAQEKAEIFSGLKAGGTAILNADIPHFKYFTQIAHAKGAGKILSVGRNSEATTRLLSYESNETGTSSKIKAEINGTEVSYSLPFAGEHYVLNSLIVLTCIAELGLPVAEAANYFGSLCPVQGRGKIHSLSLLNGETITLIDDAYNANPASMRAGISVLANIPKKPDAKRIAVLGEMLELGEESARYHRELAPVLEEAGVDLVFATGPAMLPLFESLPKTLQGAYESTADALLPHLLSLVTNDDVIFIKGSKGSKVSKIVDYFLSQPGTAVA